MKNPRMKTDYLVIGSGVAGLTFAVKMAESFADKTICVVTKANEDESNTKYAQGGVAIVMEKTGDSFQKHVQDTLIAGGGLCQKEVVERVISQGPRRLTELMNWGARFDLDEQGALDLAREGGHSENRIVHSKDLTGYEIETALLKRVHQLENITVLQNHFAIDLVTNHQLKTAAAANNQCYGAYIFNQKTRKVITVTAANTILASGGIGCVYGHTTNPAIATGDGIAMAYRAKAGITDMEFIQFHPTALYDAKGGRAFLISEAVRGSGAVLRNKAGHRFMPEYDHRAELAPRDIVSQSIYKELDKTGKTCVYLDCTQLNTEVFKAHFPNIYATCKSVKIDISKDLIPVVPAAHYLCGGIEVDRHGRTSLPGLFACGECSRTGLHGSNRLASNSLLEALVYAHSIWEYLSENPATITDRSVAEDSPFTALNDSTVEIHLKEPFPPFLGLLGMKYCSVIPKEAIDKYGDDFRKNPVGTGPFSFHFWIENTRLVMLKNPRYFERDTHGDSLPYLDAVSVSFIPDKGAAYLDLLKGNFDFMSGLHTSYSDELLTPDGKLNPIYDDKLYLQRHPFLKTDYLGFMVGDSSANDPWKNVLVRKAVNYAINREAMVRYLRNNVYTPGNGGFIPKGMPGYSESAGYSYQPDSVQALLNRAGYPSGKGLPALRLSTTSDYVDICEFVQHQLGEFGFQVKVDVLPASVHRELSARGELEFFRKSWLADYPDDENFMALFYSPNEAPKGPNYTHFSDSDFDILYRKALETTDESKRTLYYLKMDSLVMAQAPIVPLYYDVVMRFVSLRVSGLDHNPMNVLDLTRVKIEKEL